MKNHSMKKTSMKKFGEKVFSAKKRTVIAAGLVCLILLLLSSWYAVNFNDARLVVPTDFSKYTFTVKDLPMTCSVILMCLYFFYLMALILWTAVRNQKHVRETQTTRRISPRFGFLGFLGFVGFMGFWTYSQNKNIGPFMSFMFFGFFGFFYEGKLSNTFMDERFKENALKAQVASLRISFSIIIAAFVILSQGALFGNLEYNLLAAMVVVFLALALALFLYEYLLYRYDHDEPFGEPLEEEED